MGTASFEAGTLIRIEGTQYRLVRMLEDSTWQLEQNRTLAISTVELPVLLRHLEEGKLQFVARGHVAHCGQALSLASQLDLEKAKLKLMYVKACLDMPDSLPSLGLVSKDVWTKLQQPAKAPSASSLYAWKKAYLRAGSDFRALVDRHSAKGNKQPRYPQEVIKCCEEAIDLVFLSREKGSIQATIDAAKQRVRGENLCRPSSMQLPYPTRRLIGRLIAKIPHYDRVAAKRGPNHARQLFRGVKGHFVTSRPLERAEIDHTRLDVIVVDDKTGLSLGRPFVTACIDVHTRCILGIYVGFEPPSYKTVGYCLKDCFYPKTRLQETFPNIRNPWMACGVMDLLSVDNGVEFHGPLESVALSLNIEIQYSARKTPQGKPHIERFFGTLKDFIHTMPGTTFSNITERGDYDSDRHARLTLSDVRQLIVKWIADVYHQSPHRSLGTTPASAWIEATRNEGPRFPDESLVMEAVVGAANRRVLTHKGIEFEGLLYNSDDLTDLRRMQGAKLTVDIRVDESDLGAIFVIHPVSREPIKVKAIDHEYADGLSLWTHKVIRSRHKEYISEHDDQGLAMTKQELLDIITERRTKGKARGAKFGRYLESTNSTAEEKPASRHQLPKQTQTLEMRNTVEDINERSPRKKERLRFETIARHD